MKKFIFVLSLILTVALVACKGDKKDEKENHDDHAMMYSCPMHPEITSDKPGTCSICGMNLEPMEHDHE